MPPIPRPPPGYRPRGASAARIAGWSAGWRPRGTWRAGSTPTGCWTRPSRRSTAARSASATQWLTDYASCNYLGLDLDQEIIAAVPEYLARWGTHPSWSRLLGSPVLYEEIETELTELLGSEDSLVLPTITHIHMSVIPVLAGGGTIFLDKRAH
jgi:7-keto-8-aminopelargonate synthetase-like enzyme